MTDETAELRAELDRIKARNAELEAATDARLRGPLYFRTEDIARDERFYAEHRTEILAAQAGGRILRAGAEPPEGGRTVRPGRRTFSRAQIGAMSVDEYAADRDAILAALADGRIKE